MQYPLFLHCLCARASALPSSSPSFCSSQPGPPTASVFPCCRLTHPLTTTFRGADTYRPTLLLKYNGHEPAGQSAPPAGALGVAAHRSGAEATRDLPNPASLALISPVGHIGSVGQQRAIPGYGVPPRPPSGRPASAAVVPTSSASRSVVVGSTAASSKRAAEAWPCPPPPDLLLC